MSYTTTQQPASPPLPAPAGSAAEAQDLLRKVYAHMRGYNLDGRKRNPYDSDSCLRNWNTLQMLIGDYHMRHNGPAEPQPPREGQ